MGRHGTIAGRKAAQDSKRAAMFTKYARAITVAAKAGGDPDYNPGLRVAIDKAKAISMPNDNINRAIKKGTGELAGETYEELTFEGYGLGGVAVIVEALTDNKNRTTSSVRSTFDKYGGNLGTQGCVSYMFSRKGVILIEKTDDIDEDSLKWLASIIPDKIFEIGIGLETSNEDTRLNKINKGITNKSFERAVDTINSIDEYDIRAKAYLLVKPILLSEKDALEESIESAYYAKKVGVKRLAYCPSTVHGGTLMDYLWKRGSYNPPWIWTTIEIIKEVRKNVDIPMIMDTAGFGTRRGPFNCKKCNAKLKSLIIKSNLEQEIPQELEEFSCECKNKWYADLEFSKILNTTTNPKS